MPGFQSLHSSCGRICPYNLVLLTIKKTWSPWRNFKEERHRKAPVVVTESLCCSSGTGIDGKINGGKHWAIPEANLAYIYLPAGQIPQRGTSNTMYLLRSKQIAILEWPSQSLDESNRDVIARLEMCRHKHSPFTVTNVGFYSKRMNENGKPCRNKWTRSDYSFYYSKMWFHKHCVGLSHQVQIKHVEVCGWYVTKCDFQGTVWAK